MIAALPCPSVPPAWQAYHHGRHRAWGWYPAGSGHAYRFLQKPTRGIGFI